MAGLPDRDDVARGGDLGSGVAIHQQEGFPWGKEAEIRGSLRNAEKNAASCISLPMFPELTEEEVDYAIRTVKSFKK